jgi:hypothetical protein
MPPQLALNCSRQQKTASLGKALGNYTRKNTTNARTRRCGRPPRIEPGSLKGPKPPLSCRNTTHRNGLRRGSVEAHRLRCKIRWATGLNMNVAVSHKLQKPRAATYARTHTSHLWILKHPLAIKQKILRCSQSLIRRSHSNAFLQLVQYAAHPTGELPPVTIFQFIRRQFRRTKRSPPYR